MDLQNLLPHSFGFSMPSEWKPHTATWMAWPFNDDLWFGLLEEVRQEYVAFVRTIAKYEQVHLFVNDADTEADAKNSIGNNKNVTYHRVLLNDIWLRDTGPLFVTKETQVSAVKWEFNAWGHKFHWALDNLIPYKIAAYLGQDLFKTNVVLEGGAIEVNGQGVALTTKSCLLNSNRNANFTSHDIEQYLRNYLGIERLLWLEAGLVGDHTDGHIDTIARFVDTNKIVYCMTEDKSDPNFAILQKNEELLKSFTDLNGKPFELVPLLLPKNVVYLDGERLPSTYANFYIGNGFVIVPTYNDPHDEFAVAVLRSLFPTREVYPLSSSALIHGGGSIHCATQQQP